MKTIKAIKFLCIALSVVLFACSNTKVPQMQLSGKIENVEGGTVNLEKIVDRVNYETIDSAQIVDGKFSFARQLQDTSIYIFTLKPSGIQFSAILENGKIVIAGDAKNGQNGYLAVDVKGSYNDSLMKVSNTIYETILDQEKYAPYRLLIEQYKQEKDVDTKWKIKDKMELYQEDLQKEVLEQQMAFIKKHNNTYAAATLLSNMRTVISLEELKNLYDSFPEKLKNGIVLDDTKKEIECQERTLPGKPAPDFTLKNTEGKDVSFSSFKGKVVLLDFWASWCKPCRAGFPHLTDLYKKYKSHGFEIVGVSNDSNHEAWKKAIADDGITWVQTVDEFPEKYSPARVATLYAAHSLPTTYLIDKDGVILGKFHGEELDKKLEELFEN